jgi:hypothetical protein
LLCTPDGQAARPSSAPPPSTTAATTAATTQSTPPPTSPPLTRTLDPSRFASEGAVCDLLTDAQASDVGLPPPADTHATGGDTVAC